ncbi:lantibiotic dehydratase [Streptomyces cucumeris]|uniref:lantibiotic dehydratase n=1 Tax=Streptomyces cucumeris TaxID=2962890 RepID=UPI0020C87344|nr:lantibiotic dehydratase [Streptomyces sp. NEAU-Y11]MCP9213114.1 lantibiotic dehydratase [Streptomyces sp. NEAU-Y11]
MAHGLPSNYQWQPAILLRASTAPQPIPVPDLDPYADDIATQGCRWLTRVWCGPLPAAVAVASPVLCQRVTAILDGTLTDGRRIRRAVRSVGAYLLRWNHRPTPFGVFAGVTPARPAQEPHIAWGRGYRTRLRPDAEWLADAITQLEADPALLARLTVVANNTGHPRGDRHVVTGKPATGRTGGYAPVEVSIRRTRPVAAALDAARTPVGYSDLLAALAVLFPAARAGQLEGLVADLVARHVLITSLWPPMNDADALSHLCSQLDQADAANLSGVATLAAQLTEICGLINAPGTAAPWAADSRLVQAMHAVSDCAPTPVLVDAALDCTARIPEAVLTEAAEAAHVMARLSPYPDGYPQWRDYHQRFLDRYGPGTAVPVLDLTADSGLGYPAGYLGSERSRAPYQWTRRDETILRLLQEASLADHTELVLTRAHIADLTADRSDPVRTAPRAEIAVEIHAPTLDAVRRGDYRLLVTGAPRPGSSMLGRFAHLLLPDEQAALSASYTMVSPGAIPAQLSFSPRRRRNENVARVPQLLPHTIPLAEHPTPGPGAISLDDLAVTADADRFYLVRRSTGQHVEPRVPHALEASVHTPPLARFLAEITTARTAAYKSFAFGAATSLPYLPRVRYKRTILRPARWLLSADELPARSAPITEWNKALDRWRQRLHVPDRFALVENDQQLPIDLARRLDRALLRSCLDRLRLVELRETPTLQDRAWIGRPHELLIPLAHTEAATPTPTRTPAMLTVPHSPERSAVLHARLHAHPLRFNQILTAHLPDLIARFPRPPRWWFHRYRDTHRPDTGQHLALYLHLADPDDYGQAAAHAHDWAADLTRHHLASGLELSSYQPHTGHYGHGSTLDAAHAVFAADSAAAVAQIRTSADDSPTAQALTAASMVDIAARFTGSWKQAAEGLTRTLLREPGPLDRTLTRRAITLTDPATLAALPAGDDIAAAWRTRAATLTAYRQHLAHGQDTDAVLRSLLHQHQIRAVPADPDQQRITGRLARSCALRHHGGQP